MNTIKSSVGKQGSNRPSDVRAIQQLLNNQTIPGEHGALVADGRAGPQTINRITAFQAKVLRLARPDGRVDPDGFTVRHLLERVHSPRPTNTHKLTFSARGMTYLKALEGLGLKPYDDQTGKEISAWEAGATIGYGHLMTKSEWPVYENGVSEKQAETLLKADVFPFVTTVRSAARSVLRQHQFDALVLLAFNIGRSAYANSSVVRLINDPTAITGYLSLEAAWMAWRKSQGKEMKGLINRRKAEWHLFERGIYP